MLQAMVAFFAHDGRVDVKEFFAVYEAEYTHISAHMSVRMPVHICSCTCLHARACTCMYTCLYTYLHIYRYKASIKAKQDPALGNYSRQPATADTAGGPLTFD